LGLKGVQIAYDEVDCGDVLGDKVIEVRLNRTVGQDASMDGRVKGLYAPSHHLGNPCDKGDFGVIDTGRQ
jgi:hypothetical protein